MVQNFLPKLGGVVISAPIINIIIHEITDAAALKKGTAHAVRNICIAPDGNSFLVCPITAGTSDMASFEPLIVGIAGVGALRNQIVLKRNVVKICVNI